MSIPAKVLEAAVEYWKLSHRYIHPHGTTDNAGRWYPKIEERQPCCSSIRAPSARFPWSLMTHCRTAVHVAHRFKVDAKDLKACLQKKNLPMLLGMDPRLDDYIIKTLKEEGP